MTIDEYEYRVWTESADLVWHGASRDDAHTAMGDAIAEHIAYDECEGCGVLTRPSDHGFSIQVCYGDRDVTGDPTHDNE